MAVDAEVIGERQHLLALAYRMLGTVAEAEDAVQETYSRWSRNPVHGPDRVARFLLGALAGRPEVEVVERETADGLGFALVTDATVIGVVTLAVAGEAVTEVRMVLNPDKLSRWNPAKDA